MQTIERGSASREAFRPAHLLGAWAVLAVLLTLLATRNIAVPGLNYDEALAGHYAKSFLTGRMDLTLPGS